MKPAAFSYYRPTTAQEAVGLLDEIGEEAKILAGGQSLVPMMNFRLARPAALVDVTGIAGLAYVVSSEAGLEVGGLTTHAQLERFSGYPGSLTVLGRTARWIGHPAIRNRGTLGGSLAHADPAGEWPAVMLALGAHVDVLGPDGHRTVPVEVLLVGSYTTSLGGADLITAVRVTDPPARAGFAEFARRHGDFALAMAAVAFDLVDGVVAAPRVVVGGVGGAPRRIAGAEEFLDGRSPGPVSFREAAAVAAGEAAIQEDEKASRSYRRHLVRSLVERALTDAVDRAGSEVT